VPIPNKVKVVINPEEIILRRNRRGTLLGCSSGSNRNYGSKFATGEWIANLDDDDTVTPDYVQRLSEEGDDCDVLIFRMMYNNLQRWLPKKGLTLDPLIRGTFGISFAVRSEFLRPQFDVDCFQTRYCQWPYGRCHDYFFMKSLKDSGARIKISPHACYAIRMSISDKVLNFKEKIESLLIQED